MSTTWEYMTTRLSIDTGEDGKPHVLSADRQDLRNTKPTLDAWLDELGSAGWELIMYEPKIYTWIFKRPKTS